MHRFNKYFIKIRQISSLKLKKKRIAIKSNNIKNTITVTYSLVVTKFPGGRDDMTKRNKTHVNLLEYGSR